MKAKRRALPYFLLLGATLVSVTSPPGEAASKRPHRPPRRHSEHSRVTVNPSSNPASFHPEMAFGEALDIIRHATRPPINIVVLWKDLEDNAGIDRETTIGMEGVSHVPLRTHLDLLLTAVAADNPVKLLYAIRGGVILIGTEETLRPRQTTGVYDITDLVQPRADYFFLGLPLIGRTIPLSIVGTPGIF